MSRLFTIGFVAACAVVGSASAVEFSIRTVAGTGQPEDGPASGKARETNVGNPFGVETAPDGSLFICEVGNHRLRRLDLKTGELTTVAGTGSKGYAGDGGPATKALLNEPYEVRFDKAGNVYFVEMQNHLVRRIDAKTGVISTVAGTGRAGFGGDGGPAARAQLRQPHSIALDDAGMLYIADIGNHRIRRVDLATGVIDTIAGNGERKLPVDGGLAAGKPMLGPRALAVRGRELWIALREGHSVWKLDLDSGRLAHIAGTGKAGYTGDGGPASKCTFYGPKGIAFGPKGDLYVVDTENHVIRRLADGVVTTIAGVGKPTGELEGTVATKVTLARPHGVCVGPDGTVYIGDSETNRVRACSPRKE